MQYKQTCYHAKQHLCWHTYYDHPHKQTIIHTSVLMPPDAKTGWSTKSTHNWLLVKMLAEAPATPLAQAPDNTAPHGSRDNNQYCGQKVLAAATNTQLPRSKHSTDATIIQNIATMLNPPMSMPVTRELAG
jgi:hypothetical protein